MTDFVGRFYNVMRCGYYPWRTDSDMRLGGLNFAMDELFAWANGKDLEKTKLPTPKSTFPTYFIGYCTK